MSKTHRIFRAIWLGLNLALIIISAVFVRTNPDIEIMLIYFAGTLAFPISIAWVAMAGGFLALLHSTLGIIVPAGSLVTVALGGIGLTAVGYLQWFVIVPALLKRLRKQSPNS